MIGELNRRVTVKSWGHTQDEAGGLIDTLTASYTIWAKVEDRNGRQMISEQQREWDYDYKVTFRYEKSRIVTSGMTIDYDGKRLAINSLSYINEGNRKFCIARCSTQDVLVNASNDGEIVEPDGLSNILVEVVAGTSDATEAGIIVGASSYTNTRMIGREIEVNRGGHPIGNIQQSGNTEYVTKALNSDTVYFSSSIYFGEYIKITLA